MRVAVIGGGVFGTTIAWNLAALGLRVDLFEANRDLLCGASGINQYRVHRGYHYPRSPETAGTTRLSASRFMETYPEAIIGRHDHYYCIAREGSLTRADRYLAFLKGHALPYEEVEPPTVVRCDMIDLCVKVPESLFDADRLRRIIRQRLDRTGVRVIHRRADRSILKEYDQVIVAAYTWNNAFLGQEHSHPDTGQFELCEKPIVRLPSAYRGISLVMMDGPFMCFDPMAETDTFVLGNVIHAVHHRNVGRVPEVPDAFSSYLDQGPIERPRVTRFNEFVESASAYFHGFEQAEHVASMYTVRMVLPGHEHDDARPTSIRRIDHRIISVFSGKIDTCQVAAEEIAGLLKSAPSRR